MAAVRNISSIGRTKPIPVHVWIPPIYNPVYKMEVYDGTTETDVTSLVVEGEYTDGVTSTIGNFVFKIDNSSEIYTNKFSAYDKIRIYLDYGATATTLKFTGVIERVNNRNNQLVLEGRGLGSRFTSKNITYTTGTGVKKTRSTILTEICIEYFSDLDTDGIESDTGAIEVNFFERPFWEVVEFLCTSGGRDCYIDSTPQINYFESGSRENTSEAVVHGYNLIDTMDFASDIQEIVNKVRVYGAKIGNIPIIATSTGSTTLTEGDIKELKINDTNLTTIDQATERADFELAANQSAATIGTVISLGLPTLSPGEKVRISDPQNNVPPSAYKIQKYIHKFSNDNPFMTELTVQKEKLNIPNILKKNIKFQSEIAENVNPDDMDFSNVIDFTNDSGTHSNTIVNENYLKVVTGQSSGQWISDLIELSSNVTAISFQITGDFLVGQYGATSTNLWFSLDGGTTWRYYNINLGETTVPTGRDLKIRIDLNSTTSQVKAVAVLYKLS